MLGAVLATLTFPRMAVAWRFGPGPWLGPVGAAAPVTLFSARLPYGSRFHYPLGVPLSYYEPSSGATYCLSQPTGFYYVCGYSLAARDLTEGQAPATFRAAPPPGEEGLPPPPAVLIFELPQDAEAAVDDAPVGLSRGLGVTSVPPGRHRVVVRMPGAETEHAVTVSPHAILTVTPTAIVPTTP